MKNAVITVKEVTAKINKKQEGYFKIVGVDKHTYNSKSELGVPVAGKTYNIEYDEQTYKFEGKDVVSKWVSKMALDGIKTAQEIFGGEVKENKTLDNTIVANVNNKVWDDSIKIVSAFISGKKGEFSADEIGEMIRKMYNELLRGIK